MEPTTRHAIYMKADRRPRNQTPLDISPFLGEWANTTADTSYLARVTIRERNGQMLFRGFGSAEGDLIDWGEVVAHPYAGGTSTTAGGFHAFYALDGIETHLVSNQKLGILVIQSYTRYNDGSGRASHFAREFFHR